ncbi:MAG: ABC transporter permease [Armatimonadota bacterium]
MGVLAENPVLTKDLRTRMRGLRAPALLFGYLAVLSAVMFIGYVVWSESMFGGGGSAALSSRVGRNFYWALFIAQAVIVLLFAPAFTAGAITLEREQQTFDLLVITRLSPFSIVTGRLCSAASFALLLLFTSAPLVSVTFLIGGVSLGEVVCTYLSLGFFALAAGSMGILGSVAVNSTALATVITFALVGGYVGLTSIAAFPAAFPFAGVPVSPLAALCPFAAIEYAAKPCNFFGLGPPTWVPSAALAVLFSALLLTLAADRLRAEFQQPRSWPSRLLLTITILALAFCLMGWSWNGFTFAAPGAAGGITVRANVAILVGVVTFFGILLAPVLCSADGLAVRWPQPRGWWKSVAWGRWLLSGSPLAGLCLMLLWVVLCVPLAFLGAELAGAAVRAGRWQNLVALFVIAGASVLTMSLLSLALSAVTRSRPAAIALSYVLAFVVAMLPLMAMSYTTATRPFPISPMDYSPLVSSLYFNPFVAMVWVSAPTAMTDSDFPHLLLSGVVPFYRVHLLLLLLLAVSFAAVALAGTRRERPPVVAPPPPPLALQ